MDIQYVSDIHLEFHDKHNKGSLEPEIFITPVAPYLALVGDIGIPDLASYTVFLHWCSKHWTHIFLVPGNHEYYNIRCPVKTDMETKRNALRSICSGVPNVHFLDCDSFFLPEHNVRIVGCTLWSDMSSCETIDYMNDSRQIYHIKDVPATPWVFSELHSIEKEWLDQEIHKCEVAKERCLVLTHYLPSFSLIHEKYQGHFLNACFASHCDALFRPPVVGWIAGHTHTGMKVTIHGIPCVLNPYGYPHETVETRDREAVFRI